MKLLLLFSIMNLLASPGNYQLSKNPIVAKVQGSNLYTFSGNTQEVLFAFGSAASAGDTIILTWFLDAVTFTCAAVPDDSGTQFLDNAAALSLTDWVKQTIDYFNKNYKISNNFILSYTTYFGVDCIRLVTRTINEQLEVVSSGTATFTEVLISEAANAITSDNYSMLLEVWLEQVYGSGSFAKVAELEMPPDNNTLPVAEFDISKVLNSYVDIDFPLYNQNVITKCTHNQRQYYIRYAEKYGSPAVVKSLTQSSNFRVLLGAVSYQDYPASFDFFTNYLIGAKQFLSFGPSTRTITHDQQEYLLFMVPPGSTRLTVSVKMYFSNGVVGTFLGVLAKLGVASPDIYIIPAGLKQLGLDSFEGVNYITKYDLKITDQTAASISVTNTYIVNRDLQLDTHYFLFSNSITGVDTLLATGEHISGTKVDKAITERTLTYDYDRTQGQLFQYFSQKYNVFTVNTGLKTKADIDWFEDLLLSGYVVEDIGGKFIPVIINTSSIQKYKSKQNLYSLSFDYIHAYKSYGADGNLEAVLGYIIDPVGDYVVDSLGHKFILL